MVDAFSVVSSELPSATRVLAFRGTEALSSLYELQIHLWIEDPAFDMAPALGADVTLSINRQDEQPCMVHGILATLETVDDIERGAVYRAVLVPRLWQLTLTQHSRVFVGQTTPAILEEVLEGAGMSPEDYTLKLNDTYPALDHVCQYRESSFAFLSRRMEREGIYYFFEQGQSRERLVITDNKSFHGPLSSDPLRYHRVSGAGAGGIEGLRSFTCKHTTIPGSVVVRDHDYMRPALDVSGVAPASDRAEEIHLHGENLVTPEDGRRLAKVRAEELKARQVVFRGVGNTSLLRPGYSFALQDHPRQSVDGEYLTTALVHTGHHLGGLAGAKELLGLEGVEDEVYRVEVVAIPKSAQFRPERRTPVPRIYGTERAVVDGPADTDYAQLDEHGRYLVKIHFDESPAKNGKASTRIRMMQPHGGSPESFHFPLRKGTEVLLTFEGGDPDRPVIAGVVPNLFNPSAVTAQNATRNILQTGGGNRLMMEDAAGKEFIHIRSPHKGTYMHLGAPFNPAFNKVTATDGTSISFTRDISASVTGADAQTVVEDSRITVIGRSKIAAVDPPGQQIVGLMGPGFINADPSSDLLNEIQSDCNQLASDLKALNAFTTVTAATLSAAVSAIKAVVVDLDAIGADAASYAQIAGGPPPLPTGFDATLAGDWTSDVDNAIKAIAQAATDAGAATPDFTTIGSDISAAIALAITAGGIDKANWKPFSLETGVTVPATPPPPVTQGTAPTMPTLPGPSAQPTYINIKHPDWQMTTLQPAKSDPTAFQTIDDWIKSQDQGPNGTAPTTTPPANTPTWYADIQASNTIGMDPGSITSGESPAPLNMGSDIKIVGGDYASMLAGDQRAHVMGTSYGLVLKGQASVVRNGQQSKVLSPAKSLVATSSLTGPSNFVGLAFPLSLPPDPTSTIAQRSEVYGDQYSYIDGDQNVYLHGSKTTTITGDQTTTIGPSTVSTTISGARFTVVAGSDLSFVIPLKTAITMGLNTSLDFFKLAMVVQQCTIAQFKLNLVDQQATFTNMNVTVNNATFAVKGTDLNATGGVKVYVAGIQVYG